MTSTPMTDKLVAALRRRGVEVLHHNQWGSRFRQGYLARVRSRPHSRLPARPVGTLWNHITVTRDTGDFPADCLTVESIGVNRFGTGVSYNFLVDRNAPRPRIAIGQLMEASGAHTLNDKGVRGFSFNQNKVALAVAWIGMPGDRLNEHALEAMVQLRAALIEVGALARNYDDLPHSHVAWKDCPCDELRNRLPDLRRRGLAAVERKPVKPKPKRRGASYHANEALKDIRAGDNALPEKDRGPNGSKAGRAFHRAWWALRQAFPGQKGK